MRACCRKRRDLTVDVLAMAYLDDVDGMRKMNFIDYAIIALAQGETAFFIAGQRLTLKGGCSKFLDGLPDGDADDVVGSEDLLVFFSGRWIKDYIKRHV